MRPIGNSFSNPGGQSSREGLSALSWVVFTLRTNMVGQLSLGVRFSRRLLLAVFISIASLPRTGAVQVDPIGMISKRGGSCKVVSYSDNVSTSLSVKRVSLMNSTHTLTYMLTYILGLSAHRLTFLFYT